MAHATLFSHFVGHTLGKNVIEEGRESKLSYMSPNSPRDIMNIPRMASKGREKMVVEARKITNMAAYGGKAKKHTGDWDKLESDDMKIIEVIEILCPPEYE